MTTFLTISDFIGRFHPVLVHLPIGILLLAVLFHVLSYKKRFETLRPAVKLSLLVGAIAAVLSCISGWLLSTVGEYEEGLINSHQWLGISVAVVSLLAYFLSTKNSTHFKWLMPLMALLIIITGHLGGSLTHGEDFLIAGLSPDTKNNTITRQIPDVQQAVVYNDIVQPILQSKCYNCHGPAKQKGKLRLDAPSFIDKGGEGGKIILAGNAGESEMIKRLLLPLDNKDHMPPKQKPQLTKAEIALLHWWVETGADYHKQTVALQQPVKIKPYLAALQSGAAISEAMVNVVPEKKIDPAPEDVIKKLRELNVAVNPVAQNTNYLLVNFVAVDSVTLQHAQLLEQVGTQVVWLKMGHTKISEAVLKVVGGLPAVTKLFLNNSNATDKSIVYLNTLATLQYLNLSGTAVTAKAVSSLTGLKNLRQLYLYQTATDAAGYAGLKKKFPLALIDTGGYTVPFLPTDTIIEKEKPKRN
ncbi:MAG TPA: hypothetical protein PKC39_03495 [Ferruginibacter sp.]|nr:hypothetical protein [Ferruginibacter sp.]HMP20003.1 hypothetical protein [Ferruginibacter sp.]